MAQGVSGDRFPPGSGVPRTNTTLGPGTSRGSHPLTSTGGHNIAQDHEDVDKVSAMATDGMPRVTSMLRAPTLQRAKSELIRDTVAQLQEVQSIITQGKVERKAITPDRSSNYADTDCDLDSASDPDDEHGMQEYEKVCLKMGLTPLKMIKRQLHQPHLVVTNQGMNVRDVLSLSHVLLSNQMVKRLHLEGNRFGDQGTEYISALLADDFSSITHLCLNNNLIGSRGLNAIADMMESNTYLVNLALSGNFIRDHDAAAISSMLKANRTLQFLDLSHNNLGNEACILLGSAIAANESIRNLNLSWNKIRPKGAKSIAAGLKDNIVLKTLDVSMNGFSDDGTEAMGIALRSNTTLTDLDLSHNRISDLGALGLGKGLQVNEVLVSLRLQNNPITSNGAHGLLMALSRNKNMAVRFLNLSTVHIMKKGEDLIEELQTECAGFCVKYGGTVSGSSKGPLYNRRIEDQKRRNPMTIVKEFIDSKGLRLVDFFKQFDRDGGGSISREEFVNGLRSVDVPLTEAQLDDLITTLDKDGDGEVDYGELVQGEKTHRQKIRKIKAATIKSQA